MNTATVMVDGQAIVVNEGQTIDVGKMRITLTASELMMWNRGFPDNYYRNKPWATEPWYFDALDIECPGKVPQLWPMLGCTREGDVWHICDHDSFHAYHKRAKTLYYQRVRNGPWIPEPPQDEFVPSLSRHMVGGGETCYVRLVDERDQLEAGSPPTPEARQKCLDVLGLDPARSALPSLRKMLALYSVPPSSFDITNATKRTWGWWMNPTHWQYVNTSQDINQVRGIVGSGELHSPSDGASNGHYDHVAWGFVNWLLTGDWTSMFMASTLARTQVAWGLLRTDEPRAKCFLKGAYAGEKGRYRRGEGVGAKFEKEFDLGPLLFWILYPHDPMAQAWFTARSDALLNRNHDTVWNGAGGGRIVGHALLNLHDFWVATGDQRYADKAQGFIDFVFSKTKASLWFPNGNVTAKIATWEEASAHASIYRWIASGVGTSHKPHLDAMTDWLVTNGQVEVAPGMRQVAFEVSTSDPTQKIMDPGGRAGAGWTNGALWAQLPQSVIRDECLAFTLSKLPTTPSVTWGPMGAGWEKQVGMLCGMVRA